MTAPLRLARGHFRQLQLLQFDLGERAGGRARESACVRSPFFSSSFYRCSANWPGVHFRKGDVTVRSWASEGRNQRPVAGEEGARFRVWVQVTSALHGGAVSVTLRRKLSVPALNLPNGCDARSDRPHGKQSHLRAWTMAPEGNLRARIPCHAVASAGLLVLCRP